MPELTWFGWYLVVGYVLALLVVPYSVGKSRAPRSGGEATFLVGLALFGLWALLTVGTNA